MNGRIYDPVLGRFLSGDLQVTNPANLQCYNRYSYVRNNPLTLVDPSGFTDETTAQADARLAREQQLRAIRDRAEAAERRAVMDQYGGLAGYLSHWSDAQKSIQAAGDVAVNAANQAQAASQPNTKALNGEAVLASWKATVQQFTGQQTGSGTNNTESHPVLDKVITGLAFGAMMSEGGSNPSEEEAAEDLEPLEASLIFNVSHAEESSVVAAETTALRVGTPYGAALQADSAAALAARGQVEGGATLYRVGTMGKSAAGEAQFWALESPLSPGYAAKYGIPPENLAKMDFLETATLKPGSSFITRPAPGFGTNPGGGIEVVVPSGGVNLGTFSTGGPPW